MNAPADAQRPAFTGAGLAVTEEVALPQAPSAFSGVALLTTSQEAALRTNDT